MSFEENLWNLVKNNKCNTLLYSHGMKNRVLLSYLLKFREEYDFDFEAVTFISDRSPKWIKDEIIWIMKANSVKHRFIECGECGTKLENETHNYRSGCVVWDNIKHSNSGVVASSMEEYIKDRDRFLMWCKNYNLFPPFIHLNISKTELAEEYEKLNKNLISSCYHACVFCPILYKLGKGPIYFKGFYEKKVLMDKERKEHVLNEFYNDIKEYDIGRIVNLVKIYHNKYIRKLDELYVDYVKSKDVGVYDRLLDKCKECLQVK
ncbi:MULTISPECIES: hypothetical protein [Methanococcaceae]|uniref:hypothetical protein n=1 Tax=Methanococcaceae TaxID=2183 RepID=UPI00036D3E0E|nr:MULTISPECIES: hypothetical protein [Methanococcaceae]MDK2988418.1 hypothetical protein [Methanothermococcus sp.]UXM85225.1 hypothetical protein N6C89_02805 [Methanococcus aeolicus]